MKWVQKTANGTDGIPYWVWKENAHSLAESIAFILNDSLLLGKVLVSFKFWKIVHVAKCSNPESFNDFRPIAITSWCRDYLSILLWKTPSDKVITIGYLQIGFRKGCSTSTALVALQYQVASFDEQGYDYTRIMSIDFLILYTSLQILSSSEKLMAKNHA